MKINNVSIAMSTIIAIGVLTFLVVPNKKKSVDRLKNVDIYHSSYLISPIISELNRVIGNREPSLRFPDIDDRVRLGDTFQKLQEAGKAIPEEVEAIKEFEKALDNLSRAIQRLDSIPSLRREMRL